MNPSCYVNTVLLLEECDRINDDTDRAVVKVFEASLECAFMLVPTRLNISVRFGIQ